MTLNVFNWKWIFVTRLRFALFNVSNETRLVVCEGVRMYCKFPLRRSHVAWTQAVLRCDFICDRQMGVNTLAYACCKLKYWCRNSDIYCNFTRRSIICTEIKNNWKRPTLLVLIVIVGNCYLNKNCLSSLIMITWSGFGGVGSVTPAFTFYLQNYLLNEG